MQTGQECYTGAVEEEREDLNEHYILQTKSAVRDEQRKRIFLNMKQKKVLSKEQRRIGRLESVWREGGSKRTHKIYRLLDCWTRDGHWSPSFIHAVSIPELKVTLQAYRGKRERRQTRFQEGASNPSNLTRPMWWPVPCTTSTPLSERLQLVQDTLQACAGYTGRLPDATWVTATTDWMRTQAGEGAAVSREALAEALYSAYPHASQQEWYRTLSEKSVTPVPAVRETPRRKKKDITDPSSEKATRAVQKQERRKKEKVPAPVKEKRSSVSFLVKRFSLTRALIKQWLEDGSLTGVHRKTAYWGVDATYCTPSETSARLATHLADCIQFSITPPKGRRVRKGKKQTASQEDTQTQSTLDTMDTYAFFEGRHHERPDPALETVLRELNGTVSLEAFGWKIPWHVSVEGWQEKGAVLIPRLPACVDQAAWIRQAFQATSDAVLRAFTSFVTGSQRTSSLTGHQTAVVQERWNTQAGEPVTHMASWICHPARSMKVWRVRLEELRQEMKAASPVHPDLDYMRTGAYHTTFPVARALGRQWTAVLGPTNSGKTHQALEALAQAPSGIYLAPLRLLAKEVAEQLLLRGIPCDLVTGEEVIRQPGARHVAATIEAGWQEQPVEVAVVDEVQMLDDTMRGWAWVKALTGIPARYLWCLGSLDAEAPLRALSTYLQEPLTVMQTERKTSLTLMQAPLSLSEVEPGDALIAFSRREVLHWRTQARQRGLSVATIYGAQGPVVRKAEAHRFTTGQAKLLVATDAIGMGLNLPIKRLLFTALHKFDGQCERPLAAHEIAQIAGRAGRYGLHEAGEVGMLDTAGVQAWQDLCTQWAQVEAQPSLSSRQFFFNILPSHDHLHLLMTEAGGVMSLSRAMTLWERGFYQKGFFTSRFGAQHEEWAGWIERAALAPAEQTVLLTCPAPSFLWPDIVEWLQRQAQHKTLSSQFLLHEVKHVLARDDEESSASTCHKSLVETMERLTASLHVFCWLARHFPATYIHAGALARPLLQLEARLKRCFATKHIETASELRRGRRAAWDY